MPVPPHTKPEYLRYAPSFTSGSEATQIRSGVPYTVDSLARFLGHVGPDKKATDNFKAMFGFLELLAEGY